MDENANDAANAIEACLGELRGEQARLEAALGQLRRKPSGRRKRAGKGQRLHQLLGVIERDPGIPAGEIALCLDIPRSQVNNLLNRARAYKLIACYGLGYALSVQGWRQVSRAKSEEMVRRAEEVLRRSRELGRLDDLSVSRE
jgi:hypothetical protein